MLYGIIGFGWVACLVVAWRLAFIPPSFPSDPSWVPHAPLPMLRRGRRRETQSPIISESEGRVTLFGGVGGRMGQDWVGEPGASADMLGKKPARRMARIGIPAGWARSLTLLQSKKELKTKT